MRVVVIGAADALFKNIAIKFLYKRRVVVAFRRLYRISPTVVHYADAATTAAADDDIMLDETLTPIISQSYAIILHANYYELGRAKRKLYNF